jgi:hypothetical protein
MPQQLIYTSAPRGIVAGRSGHCTVARSALMREALMLQLEKFCYYQHLSLSGGQERPIFSCRIVDIRGTRFHVLSRIQDAGLDFTGRTNFIAHHLVFTPEEIRQFPTPPVILHDWPGWVKSWTKEPQLLENEDWADLTALAGKTNVPAQTWQRVTGDAVNSYGLLESRAGASFRVDDQADDTVLQLIAESLELLEVRDTRRDFRTAAWNYTFTTSMQEQDNPADFRWRCIHSDNPAANRFATPDCRELSAVRASRWTDKEKEKEETGFARQGRQPPQFAKLTADRYEIQEGAGVRLEVLTDGIPTPSVRWFEIEFNEAKEMVGKSGTIQNLNPEGRAKRYQVQAFNSLGSADSNVVEISIRAPIKLAAQPQSTASRGTAASVLSNEDYQDKKEKQLRRIETEKAQEIAKTRQLLKKIFVSILTVVLIASALAAVIVLKGRKPPSIISQPTIQTNQDGSICINVDAVGKKPLTFEWYKNNQPFSTSTNSILTLEKTTSSNSATFFVIISNSIASAKSIDVQWQGIPAPVAPPAPPNNPTAETKPNLPTPKVLQEPTYKVSPNRSNGTNQPKSNSKGEQETKAP